MKKRNNRRGFALVETLVCAVFVCTVFMLLIVNYYPMLGKLQRYQNYDETDSIYIANHLSTLIKNYSNILDDSVDFSQNNYVITYDENTLCGNFEIMKQSQCEQFFKLARINRVYLVPYSLKDLKTELANAHVSRSFELYVKYMPSYKISANQNADGSNITNEEMYDRIIVERKIEDEKNESRYIYKYANVKVKVSQ